MLYYYSGVAADGSRVRGSLQAPSEAVVFSGLRSRSIVVTGIDPANGARGLLASLRSALPVSRKATMSFYRSLAALVKAGVPLRRSLQVIIEQCGDPRLREAQRSVLSAIENGLPLSSALERHPAEFSRLFVCVIRAGEAGGVLDEVLERLATALERENALRKRLTAALTYPAVVGIAALGLVFFLLTAVVPTFRTMFAQMRVPLPPSTAALLAIGTILSSPFSWIAGGVVLAVAAAAAVYAQTSETAGAFVDEVTLRLPLVGPLTRKSIAARFARMSGMLLRSGVTIAEALDVTGDVIRSAPYRSCVRALRERLTEGSTFWLPLSQSGLFDAVFVQMVRVGEETGGLDTMLLRSAEYCEVELDSALVSAAALVEPALILLLGGAVGFIVASLFIPLYTLIGSIK